MAKKPYAETELSALWQGTKIELLQELHLLTRDGKVNSDTRRKLKQIYHLFSLIKPALEDVFATHESPTLIDLGAGKSYLGFLLYDLYFAKQNKGYIKAIEWRPELVERSANLALKLGYQRMSFLQGAIESADIEKADIVTALHACDTATDDSILLGLRLQAKYIALVPCCQAEVARSLESARLRELWAHPIHRREFGSHLTNVIRCLYLESKGYKVRVTELVGWEHSMKNEFILAEKIQQANGLAQKQLEVLLKEFPVSMKLLSH